MLEDEWGNRNEVHWHNCESDAVFYTEPGDVTIYVRADVGMSDGLALKAKWIIGEYTKYNLLRK